MRQKFPTRQILLRSDQQLAIVMALLPNLPLDEQEPLAFNAENARFGNFAGRYEPDENKPARARKGFE